MDLKDLLGNSQIIEQLARSAAASQGDARSGLEALLPAVTRGLQRNAGSATGLESLVKALDTGGHDRYLESPDQLGSDRARDDGNSILGHIFGSKQVSRNVAGQAAESSGLDSTLLKKLLPIVASLAMGSLSSGSQRGAQLQQRGSSGGTDLLGSILGGLTGGGAGSSGNDSMLDDVLDLAKKFL